MPGRTLTHEHRARIRGRTPMHAHTHTCLTCAHTNACSNAHACRRHIVCSARKWCAPPSSTSPKPLRRQQPSVFCLFVCLFACFFVCASVSGAAAVARRTAHRPRPPARAEARLGPRRRCGRARARPYVRTNGRPPIDRPTRFGTHKHTTLMMFAAALPRAVVHDARAPPRSP